MFKLLVNFHETVVKDRRMPVGCVCPSPLHHLTLLMRHRGRCCSLKLRQTSAAIRRGSRTKSRRCVTAVEPTPIAASPWRWPDTTATVDALSCVSQSPVDIIVNFGNVELMPSYNVIEVSSAGGLGPFDSHV